MRIPRYVVIASVVVVAGCSSSAKPQSPSETKPADTTSTTTAPKGVPSAPRELSAAPYGNAVAKLFWKAPKSTGASPIEGYVVTPFIGTAEQTTKAFKSPATSQTIAGLTNGAKYRFAVAAVNKAGRGPWSSRSGLVTVGAPGIPQKVTAVKSGQGTLKISFRTPGDSGAEITNFTASCTSSNGGAAKKHKGGASPLTVTGLTGGKDYKCTVTATNSRGTGPPSEPTKSLTV